MEDGSSSIIETRGMDGYALAILCHIHSNLSTCAVSSTDARPREAGCIVAIFPETRPSQP
ncbi:MAG: hypothetical protein ABFD98_05545 [Syntrophobacteraceae bacterium]